MKRNLLAILTVIVLAAPWLYGQGTITLPSMTEVTSVAANDLLWVWLDPAGANATRKIKASNLLKRYHSCEVAFGNPNANAPVLDSNDDQPRACGNVSGGDATITAVACSADAGSPTTNPILTGGSSTSILSGAINCGANGAGNWVAGTVNGSPVLHSFSANGATCSSTPCTLDANITADGTARYVIVRFTVLW